MTKTNIKNVMKKEYEKGSRQYNRLWDALTLLWKLGLVTDSEHEYIKEVNHDISKE